MAAAASGALVPEAGAPVRAPGKLLLTGAYAVLEGAPAVVIAVDRHAVARPECAPAGEVSQEVRLAFAEGAAPAVDTSALREGRQKLGLGSSAAGLVAALGVEVLRGGGDLADAGTRWSLFTRARQVHGLAQSGGSGVDVAAAVYGGALSYVLEPSGPRVAAIPLPPGLHWTAYWSGHSARTSVLLDRVRELRLRAPAAWALDHSRLADAAFLAERAARSGDLLRFLSAARAQLDGLCRLGHDCDAPIVPASFAALAGEAARAGAVFLPSGAGGGDIGLYLGAAPDPDFQRAAAAHGMARLSLAVDPVGVCAV